MMWKERIARANEGRFWKRGFTREEEDLAVSWSTCAVGEQARLGRIGGEDVLDNTELRRLGSQFFKTIMATRVTGRFGIRRAARLQARIEDLALGIDFARVSCVVIDDHEEAYPDLMRPSTPKDVEETIHA